jgi:hypothetical protein
MDSPEGSRPQMPEMPNPSDSSTHAEGIIRNYSAIFQPQLKFDKRRKNF